MGRVSYLRGMAGVRAMGVPLLKPRRIPVWPLARPLAERGAVEDLGAPPIFAASISAPPSPTAPTVAPRTAMPVAPTPGAAPKVAPARVVKAERAELPARGSAKSPETKRTRMAAAQSEPGVDRRAPRRDATLEPQIEVRPASPASVRLQPIDPPDSKIAPAPLTTTRIAAAGPEVPRAALAPQATRRTAPQSATPAMRPRAAVSEPALEIAAPMASLTPNPMPRPAIAARPASNLEEPPAGNRIQIGAIDIHVSTPPQTAAPPAPARRPAVASAAISRSFTSSFGLRQG